jgi:hypothetical protein
MMKTSKTLCTAAAFAFAACVPAVTHAATGTVVLAENFNDINALINWTQTNDSMPRGQDWFQGNPAVFPAQAGAPESYIAANFLSALGGIGSIDNWLITPELTLRGPTDLSFYTRGSPIAGFDDTLEVRFSPGSGSAPGGFTSLLTTVGGSSAYPGQWQQYVASVTLNGSGRFAFRYTGNAASSNYIGIDTLSVTTVPEPSVYLMLGLGLVALALLRRKQKNGALASLLAVTALTLPPCASAADQQAMVVVRDAETGQLRAATPAELKALRAQGAALRQEPPPQPSAVTTRDDGTLHKHLGESGMVYSVVTRDADGKLGMQCITGQDRANAAATQSAPADRHTGDLSHETR